MTMHLSGTVMKIWRLKYWTHRRGHKKKDGNRERERERVKGRKKATTRHLENDEILPYEKAIIVALSPTAFRQVGCSIVVGFARTERLVVKNFIRCPNLEVTIFHMLAANFS